MEQLIKQTLDTLARLANSQLVALFRVLDDQNCGVVGVFNQGQVLSQISEKKIKIEETPLAKILSTRQTDIYPCLLIKKWSLPFPTYKNTDSGLECLCLPLLGGAKHPVAGIVVVTRKTGISISSERLQMLKMLTPLIAAIMEEVSTQREQVIESATKDVLTDLYTRPYFEIRLQEEITRIHRHGGILSILLIDIDHFKKINSTGGYQEGDRLLQEFARILKTSIRQEIDIPCRYDIKKFIVLLPNTNIDGAYILAERIRQRCDRYVFSTRLGIPLKLTVSIGVAHNVDIPQDDNQARGIYKEELIRRADVMLEAAQQAGYNQVMAWW
jgi:diguanylate cyclase (GGDEF)-like protein